MPDRGPRRSWTCGSLASSGAEGGRGRGCHADRKFGHRYCFIADLLVIAAEWDSVSHGRMSMIKAVHSISIFFAGICSVMLVSSCSPINRSQLEQSQEYPAPAVFVYDLTGLFKKENPESWYVLESVVTRSAESVIPDVYKYIFVLHPEAPDQGSYRLSAIDPAEVRERSQVVGFEVRPYQMLVEEYDEVDASTARSRLRDVAAAHPGGLDFFFCSNGTFESECEKVDLAR